MANQFRNAPATLELKNTVLLFSPFSMIKASIRSTSKLLRVNVSTPPFLQPVVATNIKIAKSRILFSLTESIASLSASGIPFRGVLGKGGSFNRFAGFLDRYPEDSDGKLVAVDFYINAKKYDKAFLVLNEYLKLKDAPYGLWMQAVLLANAAGMNEDLVEVSGRALENFKDSTDHPELCPICGKRLVMTTIHKPTGMLPHQSASPLLMPHLKKAA